MRTETTPELRRRGELSWLRRHGLKLGLSLVLAAGFAWILQAGALPILPDARALAEVSWWSIGTYVLIYSAVHLLRAARWYWLLAAVEPVALRKVMSVAVIGFLAIILLPFRTGEVVRPMLIRRHGKLSGWAAMGTVGAERIIDGLALSILLFVSLGLARTLDPLPDRIGDLPIPAAIVHAAAYAALAGFFTAFAVMGAFYWRRDWARGTTERIVGLVSARFARWLADRVEQLAGGLQFLAKPRYAAPFILATGVYWLSNAAASWMLARACGLHDFDYVHACVTMGVLALGILVPNAPGFFGAFQISMYAGLAMFFPPETVVTQGGAYVFILYVSQLGVTIVAALVTMVAGRTGFEEAFAPES